MRIRPETDVPTETRMRHPAPTPEESELAPLIKTLTALLTRPPEVPSVVVPPLDVTPIADALREMQRPEAALPTPAPARQWVFTVTRDDDRMIQSVTADRTG